MRYVASSRLLTDNEIESNAPAYGYLGLSLAGRTRVLAELETGLIQPTINSYAEPSASRLNPDGQIGLNMSGPPWGSAFRHVQGGRGGCRPIAGVSGTRTVTPLIAAGSTFWLAPWRVTVPNFEVNPLAPYSRGYVTLRAYVSAAGIATMTLLLSTTGTSDAHTSRSSTFTVTSTTGENEAPTTAWLNLEPGRNKVYIGIRNASGGQSVTVESLFFSNIVKRTH